MWRGKMWRGQMWRGLATVVLGLQVALGLFLASAGAEGLPSLNAEPSCRAAADAAAMGSIAGGNVRDLDSCMRDENEARDQLGKEWAEFSASDQQRCTSETKTGGSPSYVELLVCLEMIRDAKTPGTDTGPAPAPTTSPGRKH
jgi:hypothetical protein